MQRGRPWLYYALHHNSHVPTHYTFDHLQCIKLYNYPCGVFACPLLHQHASTPLAWSTCYCTKCRALMYPCMPCWSFYNRPASPVYDMPASYQLACTHCHDTHWRRLSVVVAPEQGSPPKPGFPAFIIIHHHIKIPPQPPPHSASCNVCLFVCAHISKCASAPRKNTTNASCSG